MTTLRVLIVGAGVAGLSLARALHEREIVVEVVERLPEWEPTGAGLYLPGNAVRALGELGIGPALAVRATPIERQRFFDHRGRLLAEIDVDRFWEGVGGCVAIHRAALHEVLREATAEVPVRLGTSVTGLEDGREPRVTYSDGSSETYDVVVGGRRNAGARSESRGRPRPVQIPSSPSARTALPGRYKPAPVGSHAGRRSTTSTTISRSCRARQD